MSKVTSISWSSNTARLATVGADKIVQLFDEHGEKQDRFSTKPADKAARTYSVRAIEFSPDSTKLAVAQSDNIVFVYKLGNDWKDKKSICNKFAQTSSVTCLCWPSAHPNELVFGLAEGHVKVGQLKSNKAASLYKTNHFVVSMCAGPDGNSLLTGHIDGSIYRFLFETETQPRPTAVKISQTPTCVPYALAWGYAGIVAAGNDRTVRFWDPEGREGQTFDYATDPKIKEFTVAAFNPSGESVVLGNFNRFLVYAWHPKNREWQETVSREIPNLYSVTALCWRADGSRLIVGSLCGGVDMFDVCIRRTRYRNTHEFTYVSLSQVIVKNLATGARIVLKSNVGFEIKKINIFCGRQSTERFLVATTPESLLLGDLQTCRLSEIPWHSTGTEKYFFDNTTVCMIFKAGELSLVEYGCNEVLACARTEHMSPHLISVHISGSDDENFVAPHGNELKVIAYLLDLMTIRVCDLVSSQTLATISHDTRVDWLELNPNGASKLLFRDKSKRLYLYDIESQQTVSLLTFCNYVQWVPDSDVVVAQNRGQLCVWYSINAPDRVTLHEIKGDIEDIERDRSAGPNGTGPRTCVIVDEGVNMVEYELDEGLISFGSCLERQQYAKAVDLLEELPLTPETEAMWRTLADASMEHFNLPVAERCYAVLGDISKSRYLHKVNRIIQEHTQEGGVDGANYYMAQAKIAILAKSFQRAEAILLDHNELDEALAMYQELHKFDDAIRLAERKNHPQVAHLKQNYLKWLLSTQQEERAGEQQEAEGDYVRAIELYLHGGMAAKAAAVVNRHSGGQYTQELLNKIVSALVSSGMYEKAGELYNRMGMIAPAMDAFRRGHAYRQAIELAKQHSPGLVVTLEEECGDWLSSQRQVDAAINHYIEAGAQTKAIEAAMAAKQWYKAEQLLDTAVAGVPGGPAEAQFALPSYEKLASHYAQLRQYDQAERAFIKSGRAQRAVKMYVDTTQFEKAHKVAKAHLSAQVREELYVSLAQGLEQQGKLVEAEQMYLMVNDFDLAINMYKKREEYEQMLRLVAKYRKELLNDTYKHIAEQYQLKGNLKKAEHYFVEAKMWTSAMSMYRSLEKWEEAKHVAKIHGGKASFEKVVLAQAHSLVKDQGAEAGAVLLAKHGLVEIAIDYAVEHSNFQHAFELASQAAKHKMPDIHLKKALALEDDENYRLAEEEFIKASKPKEAIDMYIHQRDWTSAMRVAEAHDREGIKEVLMHQGKDCVDQNNLAKAEEFFLQAGKPEMAVQAYSSKRQVNEAVRVCKQHCPQMLGDVVDSYGDKGNLEQAQTLEEVLDAAKIYEETGTYSRAIDAYLSIKEDHQANPDRLEEVWENAIRLAMKHSQDRYNDVVADVARRLQAISRFEAAAELYESIEGVQQAIKCYIAGEVWEKARLLAQQQCPEMSRTVETEYKAHLMNKGDGDEVLKKTQDVDNALALYAKQGEWQKCLSTAERQSPKTLPHYLIQFCKIEANKEEFFSAAEALVRYSPPADQSNFPLYEVITHKLLGGSIGHTVGTLSTLRKMLMAIVTSNLGGIIPPPPKTLMEDRSPQATEFHKALLATHYHMVRCRLKESKASPEVVARISISLCRYCTEFPVDRAFYDSGLDCKVANMINMSFFFFNRFLDISDAIEDPDNSAIDNTDFLETDIPSPYDLDMPETPCVVGGQVEEVRDWVLGWSMDQSVQQKMDFRSCDKCRADIYVANMSCPQCNHKHEPCVVTGFPVTKRNRVECTTCHSAANRDDWNAYLHIYKVCPWCESPQNARP
uniref:Intraflagellar transport protein n=1 Tax=Zooxanthella nutricula TaxID=1333877 RepID=A0A7S2Q9T2_9DINO